MKPVESPQRDEIASVVSKTQQGLTLDEKRGLQDLLELKQKYLTLMSGRRFEAMLPKNFEDFMSKYAHSFEELSHRLEFIYRIATEKNATSSIENAENAAREIIVAHERLICQIRQTHAHNL